MMLFGDLSHLNIFHKIKMEIKEKLENNHFNFLFNTKPINISVEYIVNHISRELRKKLEREDREKEEKSKKK